MNGVAPAALPAAWVSPLQIWGLRGPVTVWCDVCEAETDHNGTWHRAQEPTR